MDAIMVAGHLCVDIAPSLPRRSPINPGGLVEIGSLTMELGGCVGNTGSDLADLGLPVRLAATIADDELGDLVRRDIARRGLGAQALQVSNRAGTSYSIVLQSEDLDRAIWHYPGVNAYFDEALVDLSELRAIHLGYPPLMRGMLPDDGAPLARLLARARRAGVTTSLDMAVVDRRSDVAVLDWSAILANVLPEVDVFSPSLDDLTSALGIEEGFSIELVERCAAQFIELGVAVVALSAGDRGIHIRTASSERLAAGGELLAELADEWADRNLWQPPADVSDVRTTNGAGDAATAGLLYGLWCALSPEQTVRCAVACAAIRIGGHRTTVRALNKAMADSCLPPTATDTRA